MRAKRRCPAEDADIGKLSRKRPEPSERRGWQWGQPAAMLTQVRDLSRKLRVQAACTPPMRRLAWPDAGAARRLRVVHGPQPIPLPGPARLSQDATTGPDATPVA